MSDSQEIRKARFQEFRGAQLMGYLSGVDIHEIIQKLGEPTGSGDKCRVTWEVVIDGELVTIYDWKSDEDLEEITRWNVGGHGREALEALGRVFGSSRVQSR